MHFPTVETQNLASHDETCANYQLSLMHTYSSVLLVRRKILRLYFLSYAHINSVGILVRRKILRLYQSGDIAVKPLLVTI